MGATPHALFTIDGVPSVMQYTNDVLFEMRFVDQKLARTAAWLTAQIVARAQGDSAWRGLSHAIKVVPSDEGGFVVEVHGAEESQRAHALEYGDADTAPNPLLRSALTSLLSGASNELSKDLDLSGGAPL